jgi:hypothetical protein
VLYVRDPTSPDTGKQRLVRELPKKRRPTEVSVSLQWQPWCRRQAYFDPKIDIGFVSRVPLAPAICTLARVPIFEITK